jgi:hypothetical protein
MPNRKVLIWTVLGFLWGAFFVWYTPLAGPLTDEEIAYYMDRVTGSTRSPDEVAALRRFLESDTGDDFVMVNLIELRERPQQVPGVTPGETASEVLAKYMAYMWPALLTRACHPVIVADAAAPALDLWGIEGAATWTQAAFMRYRSRREFKIAAMAKTVAFPADPWLSAGDPRLLLALVFAIVGLLLTRRRRG